MVVNKIQHTVIARTRQLHQRTAIEINQVALPDSIEVVLAQHESIAGQNELASTPTDGLLDASVHAIVRIRCYRPAIDARQSAGIIVLKYRRGGADDQSVILPAEPY